MSVPARVVTISRPRDRQLTQRAVTKTHKRATCKDASVQNAITTEEWFQHFYYLFNGGFVTALHVDDTGNSSVNLESVSTTLDEDTTALVVHDAIRALNSIKAPGPDGLCGQF